MIEHPSEIRIGDTVIFDVPAFNNSIGESIDSGSFTLTYYARTHHGHVGANVTGVAEGNGWRITLTSTVTAALIAGTFYWQLIAVSGDQQYLAGEGQFTAKDSLAYTGNPQSYDGRSQAEKDLENVQAAIRALSEAGGIKSYSIGGRTLTRYDLPDLIALETKLKAEIARERKADLIANGKGNPHNMFVRF